ncbi:prolyl oligopeptidase family serine peptidase [Flavobacteriaceae bacterium S0825]|uniref:alpha/beta hydrolase family protein n=1 Tax=Gaetbulibacter sp. S0825 TaxID=2720084 RepID=UPI001432035A|nr:prolyl oligopeptidase family serine peptidase [Gaetbulibacter sp. S0825]MCK0109769.1 prolyl oligopeptidase family serine peptidase [Flavobacteriaceae bacterium S0825]NIX65401.1 S9 family peptidase [Gaetbulibacter sp. S0825]
MISFSSKYSKLIFSIVTICFSLMVNSQDTQLKPVPEEDYGKWERINWGTTFTEDGSWIQFGIITNDGDKTLNVVNSKTKESRLLTNAEAAVFSADNNWMAYKKVLSGKAQKKLDISNRQKKTKKKAPQKMGVINLSTGDSLEFMDVVNYKFSGVNSYLAMKREKNKVNTLIVKDLKSGLEVTFGNVKQYEWQDKGTLLSMIINTDDKVGNSVQLYNPITGNLKVLDQKEEVYNGLLWRKKSADLLVLRTAKDTLYKDDSFDILFWKGLNNPNVNNSAKVFNHGKHTNFPKNTKIKSRGVSFSDNGESIFFSTDFRASKIPKEKNDENKTDDEAAEVEIWNSGDVDIIPAQKKNVNYGSKASVWNTHSDKFYLLENDVIDRIRIQTETSISIGQDQTPYDFEVMFGRPDYDLYTVNTLNGVSEKVVTKASRYWNVSPNNKYFIYLSDNHLHLYNIDSKKSINITENINASFIDIENDHPMAQKPAFGFAGWSNDSNSYLVNSEFDVWQFFTDGTAAKRLTNGKADMIIYRYQNFDRTQKSIDFKNPVYFRLFGKYNKNSGMAVLSKGKMKTLIYKDAMISGTIKAKKSDDIAFMEQTYSQSPNLFLANTSFKKPKQISNTNIFQKDYAWGKAELITYTNALGKEAQGILYYPANYVKGKKYPMITYIYEKLSDGFHRYINPSRTNYYNTTVWSQNGYFVLNPDIEFIAGDPGVSSATNLENVVKSIIDKGDVDAKKVGLIGHSWGGYQAGFVPTQTDIFAASVAGAGLTELISMNLAVTPAFGGMPENAHFEVSQERMEVAPWKAPDSYLRNSSVMNIEKLNTPIMFEVGDNDENVNWFQGIAYYNAARRAAKPFVLLVYAKEGHGLRQDKNRKDYQQRILKWFGHYLKGEPAEDWMTEGIPYAEQQRRLKNKYKD